MRSHSFGFRSTADQVLAGIDLTGKRFLVTGAASGIGLQLMHALAANGAEVIALARTPAAAQAACAQAGRTCVPLGCDLRELSQIAGAAAHLRDEGRPLDGIIANAGVAHLPSLSLRYGVETHMWVNYVAHFALVNELAALLRDGSARVVIATGSLRRSASVPNLTLDAAAGVADVYDPQLAQARASCANALFAMQLARRLAPRGILVNAAHPGPTRGTRHHTRVAASLAWLPGASRLLLKNSQQGAATAALLIANPSVARTGGYWENCRGAMAPAWLADEGLAARLWDDTCGLFTERQPALPRHWQEAA